MYIFEVTQYALLPAAIALGAALTASSVTANSRLLFYIGTGYSRVRGKEGILEFS